MGGGSGGGKQTSESVASYPEEFRPLATSARKEIQALQKALPLVSHAQFQPASVPGLSPVEQFTINELVMRTPYLPESLAGLLELPEPVGVATKGAARAGAPTKASEGALGWLSDYLGRDVRAPQRAPVDFPVMTRLPMPETAFPTLSRATLQAVPPQIAMAPVPLMTPPPLPPPAGPVIPPEISDLIAQLTAAQPANRVFTPPPGSHFYGQAEGGDIYQAPDGRLWVGTPETGWRPFGAAVASGNGGGTGSGEATA